MKCKFLNDRQSFNVDLITLDNRMCSTSKVSEGNSAPQFNTETRTSCWFPDALWQR